MTMFAGHAEIDAVGLDTSEDCNWVATEIQPKTAVQGNLGPFWFCAPAEKRCEERSGRSSPPSRGVRIFSTWVTASFRIRPSRMWNFCYESCATREIEALAYLWIKALHIVAVISWMAGLLYLPRLFVYHSMQTTLSPASEMLKIMEFRLLNYIMTPAMIVVWLSGGHLAITGRLWLEAWFLAKIVLVAGMTITHAVLTGHRRAFADDNNTTREIFSYYQ